MTPESAIQRFIYPCVFSLLHACVPGALSASRDPATATQARLAQMLSDELPGVQYVVVNQRGPVFDAALGVRDAKTNEAMQHATLQMAYSMTKAITAIAVMQLVDDHRLGLDDSLAKYVVHPYGNAVTIRHLLAQTSGVPNPLPLDWFELEGSSFARDEKLREVLRKNPKFKHAPGTEYSYSNLSYWLLEKAIERASGSDYAKYAETHIFAPLSVNRDSATFDLPPPGMLATGHSRRFSAMNLFVQWMSPSEYWVEASGPWSRTARVVPHGRGYGGLFANANALAEVLRDLLREDSRLLSAKAKAQMFTQQRANEEPIAMALGWVTGTLNGVQYFGKQGGGLGFHGNLRLYRERGLATVLLANRTELSAGAIDARSDELDAAFLGALTRDDP